MKPTCGGQEYCNCGCHYCDCWSEWDEEQKKRWHELTGYDEKEDKE